MAIAASLKIINTTGGTIMFTQVAQINDDATWSAPNVGDKLANGASTVISMGNASMIPFVRGCGCSVQFTDGNFNMGSIYFDDPAIGAHTLAEAGPTFSFSEAGSDSGNSNYVVTISQA